MKESILTKKSFDFSIGLYSHCKKLREERFDYAIVDQLIRSGTAIGALVREAEFAQSRPDFINKLSIALKEANETIYGMELIKAVKKSEVGTKSQEDLLLSELKGMLIASIKTAKSNLDK
jgi:four helix bundle protein